MCEGKHVYTDWASVYIIFQRSLGSLFLQPFRDQVTGTAAGMVTHPTAKQGQHCLTWESRPCQPGYGAHLESCVNEEVSYSFW